MTPEIALEQIYLATLDSKISKKEIDKWFKRVNEGFKGDTNDEKMRVAFMAESEVMNKFLGEISRSMLVATTMFIRSMLSDMTDLEKKRLRGISLQKMELDMKKEYKNNEHIWKKGSKDEHILKKGSEYVSSTD